MKGEIYALFQMARAANFCTYPILLVLDVYCLTNKIGDNAGAKVVPAILSKMLQGGIEFVMEVTEKTKADIKGGTLIWYENKLRLLELSQVPYKYEEEFKSIKKFNVFNTNNIWCEIVVLLLQICFTHDLCLKKLKAIMHLLNIPYLCYATRLDLRAVDSLIDEGTLDMDVIVNEKTTDDGVKVIQLETAIGAAIKCFKSSLGIKVPRSRFIPVKHTSDLFLVKSNLYTIENGVLTMSSDRMFDIPLVELGTQHFRRKEDFESRFAFIPDILELHHLTVSGDVTFGRSVVLKGTVIIIAENGDRKFIPDGSILENKIVSGNLRIFDYN